MTLFGLGTVPALAAVGCGASLVSLAFRRRLLHIAAWCVVATGLLSIFRGLGFLEGVPLLEHVGCPLCK
jgi:sulfite exporter TauE/SafE